MAVDKNEATKIGRHQKQIRLTELLERKVTFTYWQTYFIKLDQEPRKPQPVKKITPSDFWLLAPQLKQHEITRMVHRMLEPNPLRRPTAAWVLEHPFFWSINKRALFYTQLKVTIEAHLTHRTRNDQSFIYRMNNYDFMRVALDLPKRGKGPQPAPEWSQKIPDQMLQCFNDTYTRTQLSHLVRGIRNMSVHYSRSETLYFGAGQYGCMGTICNIYPNMTEKLWNLCRNSNHPHMDAMIEFR